MSHPSYKQHFADNLKRLREAAGLTQRSAAEKISGLGYECSHSKWGHWESGLNSPPIECLPFLAKVVGKKKVSELFP